MGLLLIALNLVGGLLLEAWGAAHHWGFAEPLVDALTLLHLGALLVWPPTVDGEALPRRTLVGCLLLATLGEAALALGLGLYRYRQGGLPLFVPPGHVLVFVAGLRLARTRLARWAPRGVVAVAVPALAFRLAQGTDALSLPLLALLLLCLWRGPAPRLYAVMFVLALLLELWGTGLQAWRWAPALPFGLRSANPPLAAGAFYALLDLLTLAADRLGAPQRRAARATAAT